jgi:hypothetical protein
MSFQRGEAYRHTDGKRTAIVIDVRDDGRAGLLRYSDTGEEEWHLWDGFQQAGRWIRI